MIIISILDTGYSRIENRTVGRRCLDSVVFKVKDFIFSNIRKEGFLEDDKPFC